MSAKPKKPLYKTTIVIWSEEDPRRIEVEDLARDADRGNSYCSRRWTELVTEPAKDPHWDGTEFFDGD